METVLALTRRLKDASDLVSGDLTWDTVSGLIGLFWLPVMIWVLWLTVRRMGWLGRRTREDAATIAATASTSHEWQWEADADLSAATNARSEAPSLVSSLAATT